MTSNTDTANTIAKATINALILAVADAVKNYTPTAGPLNNAENITTHEHEVMTHALKCAARKLDIHHDTAYTRILCVWGNPARLINRLAEAAAIAINEWADPLRINYDIAVAEMFYRVENGTQ